MGFSALAGPLISAGLQFGASKLLGGGKKTPTVQPLNPVDIKNARKALAIQPRQFNAGGLALNFLTDPNGNPTNSPRLDRGVERQFGLDQLQLATNQANNIFGRSIEQLTPGFGALTEARTNAIESARRRTVGDLRDNLARRRVLGSSFAGDQIARANAEFAQQDAQARAVSFLEELDTRSRLARERFGVNMQNFQQQMSAFNFEASIAAGMAGQLNSIQAANNQAIAQIIGANAQQQNSINAVRDIENDKGIGKFVGGTLGNIDFGNVLSGFGGGGSSPGLPPAVFGGGIGGAL